MTNWRKRSPIFQWSSRKRLNGPALVGDIRKRVARTLTLKAFANFSPGLRRRPPNRNPVATPSESVGIIPNSLCGLWELCVSVVDLSRKTTTTETRKSLRRHRERLYSFLRQTPSELPPDKCALFYPGFQSKPWAKISECFQRYFLESAQERNRHTRRRWGIRLLLI